MDLDLRLDLGLIYKGKSGQITGGTILEEGGDPILEEGGDALLNEDGATVARISELDDVSTKGGLENSDEIPLGGPSNIQSYSVDMATVTNFVSNNIFFEATLVDENDSTYMYYGGDKGSDWQIDRVLRTDGTRTRASEINNPTVTNLTDAWNTRGTLTYG